MTETSSSPARAPVVRFAPSPTGYLHIGGARTALFNWLYAKAKGGTFLLRIEDTDRERNNPAAVAAILDGLSWLGLDWDGEPVSQFSRADRHREVARALLDQGAAYRCYLTAEELDQMRKAGEIPAGCRFKVSAHSGHGNPCSARLLAQIGADSINPVRDIQLQMLAAIRQAVDIPVDVHTENPASSGGFIRHYEVPEMVRVAAPIYLKTGGSVAKTHSWDSSDADAAKRAKQVQLVKRVLDEYYPDAISHAPAGG